MGTTIRNRFVALDLADAWIELRRTPWRLRHVRRAGDLWISLFPVAEGVAMDVATMQHREHERRRREEALYSRLPKGIPFVMRTTLLDETAWVLQDVFCMAARSRLEMNAGHPFGSGPMRTTYRASWTVSDGRYVLEASFGEVPLVDDFTVGVADCDAMMKSVSFEGPS